MRRKYILLISVFLFCSFYLSAQHSSKGPALNPDLMSYFQDEITSLLQFQKYREDFSPFFFSYRQQSTYLELMGNYEYDGYNDVHNSIKNIFAGFQIKINESIYIPFFYATSIVDIYGWPDDDTDINEEIAVIRNEISWKEFTSFSPDMEFSNNYTNSFIGSGIVYDSDIINIGAFLGYYFGNYETVFSIYYRGYPNDWYQSHGHNIAGFYPMDNSGKNNKFRLAIIPNVNTSGFKYIGYILNNILGYIGLGETVDIYTIKEEKSEYSDIVNLLNLGLNFTFNKINFGPVSINSQFFSKRMNYDAVAKNDIFGLSLTTSFWRIKIPIDFGYRKFYSTSKYFVSQYPNTWFIDAGISFSIKSSILQLSWQYDNIRDLQFKITFDIKEAFTLFFSNGRNDGKTIKENEMGESLQWKRSRFHDEGIRYRYVKGDLSDFFNPIIEWFR
jgi:hypothetical protein